MWQIMCVRVSMIYFYCYEFLVSSKYYIISTYMVHKLAETEGWTCRDVQVSSFSEKKLAFSSSSKATSPTLLTPNFNTVVEIFYWTKDKLQLWIVQWVPIFVSSLPWKISKNHNTTYDASSKVMIIWKIWRTWLRKRACHAPLNFKT